MSESIFRKKSLDRIASPDKLDEYLKTASPSGWLLLAALGLILAAAGAWCFLGVMPTTSLGISIQENGNTVCYVPAADGYTIQPGMKVMLTLENGDVLTGETVETGAGIAASQAAEQCGMPWIVAGLPDEWVCPVTIRLPEGAEVPAGATCSTQIVLQQERPIDLLMGR